MLRLTEFKLKFPEGTQVKPEMGSVFHGALMGKIAPEAAERFHEMNLRPYSQAVFWNREESTACWRIGTLDEYAYEQLIGPLEGCRELFLKQKGYAVQLQQGCLLRENSPEVLSQEMIQRTESPSGARWQCHSVMSFKQKGRYVILPDARLLYQNLLQRWNTFYPEIQLEADDLSEQLADHCRLNRYDLHSQVFSVEGSRIYGCMGTMEYQFFGFDMLKRIQGLLCSFAEFAGVGIKTAMGMGSVDIKLL